ncbi:MAG: glycosyltransferase [Muribaculaceae bacterium]|nr:glycosyltransferase [Muribaculaceae bacterium]
MPTEEKRYVGIFNDSFPPIIDGVTQTILNYVDWLRSHGYDPCVVTPYNPVKTEVPYKVMRYFSLPIRSRHPYRYGYPKLDPYIWGKMRNTPFRLIHSHSPFAAGRLGVYAKKHQGMPLIGTFHSKYKSDLKHSFKLMPFCVPIIMKRILNFYNACDEVWIPQASVEETVREYGYKGKLEVVDNGIDYKDNHVADIRAYKAESRKLFGIPDDTLTLLFVGQHIWEKGIGIIVDALARVKPDVKFRMEFIGEGYAKADLLKMIDERGLSSRVVTNHLIMDREELGRHYAAADLFLFPSLYDNAPLVVREAASLGTPSIIPNGSTTSEVVTDGVNGFLSQHSADAYARMIERLYDKRDGLVEVGLNASDSFVRGWNDVMEEVADRYEKLIKRTTR